MIRRLVLVLALALGIAIPVLAFLMAFEVARTPGFEDLRSAGRPVR